MKKICIAIISIALIIAFGISLNNVEKTELQSTDGRDFEKATVQRLSALIIRIALQRIMMVLWVKMAVSGLGSSR